MVDVTQWPKKRSLVFNENFIGVTKKAPMRDQGSLPVPHRVAVEAWKDSKQDPENPHHLRRLSEHLSLMNETERAQQAMDGAVATARGHYDNHPQHVVKVKDNRMIKLFHLTTDEETEAFDRELGYATRAAQLGIAPEVMASGRVGEEGTYGYIVFEQLDGTFKELYEGRLELKQSEEDAPSTPQVGSDRASARRHRRRFWTERIRPDLKNLSTRLETMLEKMLEHKFLHDGHAR